ncbi:MAG: hypothetical protein FRX49_12144 [Trebouxia sp. A1-2]|nr:MAG: hypothetical protein FRX49_12144 [Trebouxia sp. A1-2]
MCWCQGPAVVSQQPAASKARHNRAATKQSQPKLTSMEGGALAEECRVTAAACKPSTDAFSAPAALRRGVGSGALLKISAISRNAASANWARLRDNEKVKQTPESHRVLSITQSCIGRRCGK